MMNADAETDDTVKPAEERPKRRRAFKGARAAFNHEQSDVPCTVKDESETGAKLLFEDGWWVPDHFTLFVDIDCYKVDCEKVWHKGNLYGVHFLGEKIHTGVGHHQHVRPPDSMRPDDPIEPARQTLQVKAPGGPAHKAHRPTFGKLGK